MSTHIPVEGHAAVNVESANNLPDQSHQARTVEQSLRIHAPEVKALRNIRKETADIVLELTRARAEDYGTFEDYETLNSILEQFTKQADALEAVEKLVDSLEHNNDDLVRHSLAWRNFFEYERWRHQQLGAVVDAGIREVDTWVKREEGWIDWVCDVVRIAGVVFGGLKLIRIILRFVVWAWSFGWFRYVVYIALGLYGFLLFFEITLRVVGWNPNRPRHRRWN
jgi:hypothetical protein